MATGNGAIHTKRPSVANRGQSHRSASDRLGKQTKELKKDLRDLGETAKHAAAEELGKLRANAGEYCEEKRNNVQHGIEQYIADRPLKTILIAAGVGLLFGRFWMRR
ncbi:MAG: hypothetical protein HZA51_14555 [Planctomycetes bacterium]|nr:hypothetical protein [Planctomycetota bacterium]